MSRGAVRRGEALLAGLLPCGHCGRKLHVAYSGENGSSGRYHCRGGHLNHGGDPCVSFGGMRIDRAVGVEVIECLQPLGVEAAISALEARQIESAKKRAQVDLALEQARYEAALARRRYDAVDPDNGRLKPNAIRWQRGPYLRSPPQSGDVCSPSAQTSSGPGTARARRRRPASGSPYPDRRDRRSRRGRRAQSRDPLGRRHRTPLRVRKNRAGQHRSGTDADVVELVSGWRDRCRIRRLQPCSTEHCHGNVFLLVITCLEVGAETVIPIS